MAFKNHACNNNLINENMISFFNKPEKRKKNI